MKKLTILLALAGFTFFASSCSKENVNPTSSAKVTTVMDKNNVGTDQIPPP